jgi:hypothetical protein
VFKEIFIFTTIKREEENKMTSEQRRRSRSKKSLPRAAVKSFA